MGAQKFNIAFKFFKNEQFWPKFRILEKSIDKKKHFGLVKIGEGQLPLHPLAKSPLL